MPATVGREDEGLLDSLLELLKVSPSKQNLPNLHADVNHNTVSTQSWPNSNGTECSYLEKFSSKYENVRNFQKLKTQAKHYDIFCALIKYRLNNNEWLVRAPYENVLRVLTVLRILLRDSVYQSFFISELSALPQLSTCLSRFTQIYLNGDDSPSIVKILTELTNILQKLSLSSDVNGRCVDSRELIVESGAHDSLVKLLSAMDITLTHCTMYALVNLTESEKARSLLAETCCTEMIVTILKEYDQDSRRIAAKLLRNMCLNSQTREWLKLWDVIPLLVRLLSETDLKLLRYVVWCIVHIAEDKTTNDLRDSGVIPLLIKLIQEPVSSYSNYDTSTTMTAPASATLRGRTVQNDEDSANNSLSASLTSDELNDQVCSLKAACCTALANMTLVDQNQHQIVSNNGVYVISCLILPDKNTKSKQSDNLKKSALRSLRFLFSMERYRRMFKRIFQGAQRVYQAFTDVGHYIHSIEKYEPVLDRLYELTDSEITELRENILGTNQQREACQTIQGYDVLELLGSGAFGSVYKVRKTDSRDSFYALKEVNLDQVTGGRKDREKSKGELISEINMIREQLKHPNVVKYYKTLVVDNNKLCIVMELIDGAPIGEHFTSLKEKGQIFTENRIWHIFVQIVLALGYLHKEKHIVHRDLSPNNIMLGENDKLTITDFGLAKHKGAGEQTYLKSCVGTLNYSCPEIVQSQPYTEKADIWAIGCVLYQMCTLHPPFQGNLLALPLKIVEGKYDPIPDYYSLKVSNAIGSCLTVDQKLRPDIHGVAGVIAEQLISYTETIRIANTLLERKLEKEKRRTQSKSRTAKNYKENYQRLLASRNQTTPEILDSLQMNGKQNGAYDINNNEKGGMSGDDEEEPSSSDSCGSSSSLRRAFSRPPIPPAAANERCRPNPSAEQCKRLDFSQLNVEIPGANKARDSGCSSAGEPSPGNEVFRSTQHVAASFSQFHRSISTPVMDSSFSQRRQKNSSSRSRPNSNSTATTLSISPRKVRQISDPVQQMFIVLHKVIYVTQLPPTLKPNPLRSIIDKFKRSLFAPSSNPAHLKTELKKLASGSADLIELNLGSHELHEALAADSKPGSRLHYASSCDQESGLENDFSDGITYEKMLNIMERVLHENNYYSIERRTSSQTPLQPIRQNQRFPS